MIVHGLPPTDGLNQQKNVRNSGFRVLENLQHDGWSMGYDGYENPENPQYKG